MSRIGRAPIAIPERVKVTQDGAVMTVEGPKGKMTTTFPSTLSASIKDGKLLVERASDLKTVKSLHGLHRALVANMVRGVSEGFTKELEIVGLGYRAQAQAKQLDLFVGFSHSVKIPIPEGMTIETPKPTIVIIKGADKQLVGQVAANIRHVAPPEPYKGKGIRYLGESIRRKAGKAATGAKGASAG
ncbi:MAG: 50S ribosomal protein L6 [Candidatus Omnitrophica bacterium]|nr:50S ribosomal protein L6 [Candidatus Omnitrophota bacterium]